MIYENGRFNFDLYFSCISKCNWGIMRHFSSHCEAILNNVKLVVGYRSRHIYF